MKKILTTIVLALMACVGVSAQDVDVMPEFPGGQASLMQYLSQNLKYPSLAAKYGVEGRVKVHFIIDTKGKPTNITAEDCKIENLNSPRFAQETKAEQQRLQEQFALLFAKEGARVVRKMPRWRPGRKNGESVNVNYVLPIRFQLPQ